MTPKDFIRESNRIERILRGPTAAEVKEYWRFMKLNCVDIEDLNLFVSIYQPGVRLRTERGMNVFVGSHTPPPGGPEIGLKLETLLAALNEDELSPYSVHLAYENLHPFTDCNGRSGRMLWMWQMRFAPLGFLHTFYYQALQTECRVAPKKEKL